jgi:hypothetical protein
LKGRELAGQGDEAEVLRRVEKVAQKLLFFMIFPSVLLRFRASFRCFRFDFEACFAAACNPRTQKRIFHRSP